jgi:hypothetical protein
MTESDGQGISLTRERETSVAPQQGAARRRYSKEHMRAMPRQRKDPERLLSAERIEVIGISCLEFSGLPGHGRRLSESCKKPF